MMAYTYPSNYEPTNQPINQSTHLPIVHDDMRVLGSTKHVVVLYDDQHLSNQLRTIQPNDQPTNQPDNCPWRYARVWVH